MKISIEQAAAVLDSGRELFGNEDLFKAIRDGTVQEYYTDIFRSYRWDYSDDLPEPDVPRSHERYVFYRLQATDLHPSSPRMKCRGNVIFGLAGHLEHCKDNVGPPAERGLSELHRQYVEYPWNYQRGGKGEYWTQQEEIDFMNQTLDAALDLLK